MDNRRKFESECGKNVVIPTAILPGSAFKIHYNTIQFRMNQPGEAVFLELLL